MLWFRPVSAGVSGGGFTVQVPFQLGPSHQLRMGEAAQRIELGSFYVEITENRGVHLLRVGGLTDREGAEALLPRARGALLRATVLKKLSLRSPSGVQAPHLFDPPVAADGHPTFEGLLQGIGWTHLDGFLHPSPSVVIPEHLRLLESGAGNARITITMPAMNLLEIVREGLELPSPEKVVENEKLSLAVDLYASALAEAGHRAKVITLSSALEALLTPDRIPEPDGRQVDKLLAHLESLEGGPHDGESANADFARLRSRLAGLKRESISRRMRKLVEEAVPSEPDLGDRISRAYGVRSTLLHDGTADADVVRETASWMLGVVPRVLEHHLDRACNS